MKKILTALRSLWLQVFPKKKVQQSWVATIQVTFTVSKIRYEAGFHTGFTQNFEVGRLAYSMRRFIELRPAAEIDDTAFELAFGRTVTTLVEHMAIGPTQVVRTELSSKLGLLIQAINRKLAERDEFKVHGVHVTSIQVQYLSRIPSCNK